MKKINKGIMTFVLTACMLTTSCPVLAEELSVPTDNEPQVVEAAESANVTELAEAQESTETVNIAEISEAINNEIVVEGIVAQLAEELDLEVPQESEVQEPEVQEPEVQEPVEAEELDATEEAVALFAAVEEESPDNLRVKITEAQYKELAQQTTGIAVFKFAKQYTNNTQIKEITGCPTIMAWSVKVANGTAKLDDVFYYVHEHTFGEASCTAAATCECGATEGDPLPHTFVDGKCQVCEGEDPDYVDPKTINDPEIAEKQLGIRVPEGFAVEFGYQQAYKHTYISETGVQNNVWVYDVPSSKVYFYRVYSVESNNDAVTYWGWLTSTEYRNLIGTIIEVTEENLNLNNDRNADTVDEYLTNNIYDTRDILITGNADGYVNLAIGETWTLNCYRMWEIIESFMNANISQPDFHIEIISPDGTPSDCLEITKNTGDGSANTVTAVKEGQAILKITYDAVTVDSAMGGTNFSAIAPENTALFVITVGQQTKVNDGIDLDTEVDIQYYTGENGAVIVATPDEGSTVEVARCIYDDEGKLQLTRFSDTGVEVNEDGTVKVVGLTEGSSVIKVTDSEGNSAYQVIKAKAISFSVQDLEGNIIDTAEHVFAPGEQVKIVADKFYDVFMKSAGVYNGSCYLTFTLTCKDAEGNELSETFKSKENIGYGISYDQASNPVYRTVEIVIPEKWDGESEISLDCDIYRNTRFGLKLTAHRSVYKNAGMTNVNGYMIQTTTAETTVDAVDINSVSEFVKDPNTTPVLDLIGTEILTGDVTAYNNAKVEYKNK